MKRSEILSLAQKVEEEFSGRILFLVESGSRVWRFASEDSDNDLRGVFVYNTEKYLGLKPPSETISFILRDDEGKAVEDIELWEFGFFVKKMMESNPTVYEWLVSDIVYINREIKFYHHKIETEVEINRTILRELFFIHVNKDRLRYHYSRMMYGNFKKFLDENEANREQKVKVKKYLYVLRAMACCLCLEDGRFPSLNSYEVILYLSQELQDFFHHCVKLKMATEKTTMKRCPGFQKVVEDAYRIFRELKNCPNSTLHYEEMDELVIQVRLHLLMENYSEISPDYYF